MPRPIRVFGPAYVDRVLRVDRPLLPEGGPLDRSIEAREWEEAADEALRLQAEDGQIVVALPPGWPGPRGRVRLSGRLLAEARPWSRPVRGMSWLDDLGGMGAGFAKALGGELIHALGEVEDAMQQSLVALLAREAIVHRPLRVAARRTDWTLLVTSGAHGDKLAIGARGCHAALDSSSLPRPGPCALLVVAGLPNRLAASILQSHAEADLRFFAPALRNMTDREPPLAEFCQFIDVLCCNRHEWETLADRETVEALVPIVAVTDGARGSRVKFPSPAGDPGFVEVAAFPRSRPPRDTNRAGEAYASALIATLIAQGWTRGPAEDELIRHAARRASAAAALVLDLEHFGFPSADEIDATLQAELVE